MKIAITNVSLHEKPPQSRIHEEQSLFEGIVKSQKGEPTPVWRSGWAPDSASLDMFGHLWSHWFYSDRRTLWFQHFPSESSMFASWGSFAVWSEARWLCGAAPCSDTASSCRNDPVTPLLQQWTYQAHANKDGQRCIIVPHSDNFMNVCFIYYSYYTVIVK